MFKKVLLSLSMIGVNLFAIDVNSVVNELSCKTYSMNGSLAGIYKEFDTAESEWFLYMPSLNYLLIHKTGYNKVSDGAEVISPSDFNSIKSQSIIQFGDYIGSSVEASKLSNNSYNINGSLAGLYKEFDPSNKLWFLYMPKLNYLLVHETGKSKTTEGAIVINVQSYFSSIDVIEDPFGNVTGSIQFVPISGCTSSSEMSSSSDLETPPNVPNVGSSSSSSLETPPTTPTIQ